MDLLVICFLGFCLWHQVSDICIFAYGFYCRGKLFAWIFRYLSFISVVTIIFALFGLWCIKTHPYASASHWQKINQLSLITTAATMLEEPQPKPKETIEKLRHIVSKYQFGIFMESLKQIIWLIPRRRKWECSWNIIIIQFLNFMVPVSQLCCFCLNYLSSYFTSS